MAAPLGLAAILIGYAIQLNNGSFNSDALIFVTVAIACSGFAVAAGGPRIERWQDRPVVVVLALGLAYQLGAMLTNAPGVYLSVAAEAYRPHHFAVAAAAILCGAALAHRLAPGRAVVPLLLCTYFFLGHWLIKSSPNPHIDVYAFHQEAFRTLSRRADPYAVTMPNIYGHTFWYAEHFATPDRVLIGFLYPPLSLFLAWLGNLFGDYRYATALAAALAGGCMAYARRNRLGAIAAAVFLFTPRGLFVLEQGWTEPFVVFFLAATVFCACRVPKAVPWVFGLLLAVKQYCVFLLPLSGLLLGSDWSWRRHAVFLGKAVLVAALVTLPLAAWDVRGFMESVVFFQARQPFRSDALSYAAWWTHGAESRLPGWISFAVVIAAAAFCAWRAPRTPAGFAAASAFALLLFFAFAKQAFCNYYFMIIGALCCSLAALEVRRAPVSPAARVVEIEPLRLFSANSNRSSPS
jgi:hypothetical protein